MSDSVKNVLVFAICIVVVVAGYWLISGSASSDTLSINASTKEELLKKTEAFIARSERLDQVVIDRAFFSNESFISLRSFASDVPDQSVGRDNIFNEARTVNAVIAESAE